MNKRVLLVQVFKGCEVNLMNATTLTVILWSGLISQAFAQQGSLMRLSLEEPVVRAAQASTIRMELPNRDTSSRRLQAVDGNPLPEDWQVEPNQVQNPALAKWQDRTSFNASQPVSRLLANPDQFWTRKSRPVIDQRGEELFGDPCAACDEWKGFCGCCGTKANPGHLGLKWVSNGAPCECIDDCCPPQRDGGCLHGKCR